MSISNDSKPCCRIDSHQHFWRKDRGDYHWLTPDLGILYRDYLPHDLHPELYNSQIDQTVLVQAAATEEETHFLLMTANYTNYVGGVVGWVDMEASSAAARLTSFSKHPVFKGIRPMVQDLVDDDWLLKPALEPAIRALIELNLCFDALVKPQHLDALHTFVRRYPDLKVVINHGAKPDIANGRFEDWSEKIARISDDSQAYCKFSGLISEAAVDASFSSLNPYLDHLVKCFGPKRLMWGSDWPVLNMASNYGEWTLESEKYISQLSTDDQKAIWSESAQNFYGIEAKNND